MAWPEETLECPSSPCQGGDAAAFHVHVFWSSKCFVFAGTFVHHRSPLIPSLTYCYYSCTALVSLVIVNSYKCDRHAKTHGNPLRRASTNDRR